LIKIYLESLTKEMTDFIEKYDIGDIKSVYIGGGNPSINVDDILRIDEILNTNFKLNGMQEYTIECNPLNTNKDFVRKIKLIGINRVSVGVQSFIDKSCEASSRMQKKQDVIRSMELFNNDFDNISIDLINGLPYSDPSIEVSRLDELLSIYQKIKHISFYELTLSEKCKFNSMKLPFLSECERERYEMKFQEVTVKYGFKKYEISNYCKDGYESIHNLSYWKYKNYAGFGPGAHSTIDGIRTENGCDIENYLNDKNRFIKLSKFEQIEEFLLMGLRLIEGINLGDFTDRFKFDLSEIINAEKYKERISIENNRLKMTKKGMDELNKVLVDLFCDIGHFERKGKVSK
jgi:oxygen-independent coproporphyrinogen III oxidase